MIEESLIYNEEYSIINNSELNNIKIVIEENNSQLILSAIKKNNEIISPNFGTFSNIYVTTSNAITVNKLVKKLIYELKKNFESLFITFPPFFYDENINLIITYMLANGANIQKFEINNHVNCDNKNKFSSGNLKKLNKLIKEGFKFRKGSISELKIGYDIICKNRMLKGYDISMTYEKLESLFYKFNEFKLWFVEDNDKKPVASSITIDIKKNIKYVFYWGDIERKNANSPIVMMANGLINENIKEQKSILDLGTSSLSGVVNNGLLNFKRSLGAKDTLKITLKLLPNS